MKIHSFLFLVVIAALTVISSCTKEPELSLKERNTSYISEKQNGWTLESVALPSSTATIEVEWVNFALSPTSSMMTTSGHATGAEVVWPSSSWIMNPAGDEITRTADNIVMRIVNISEKTLIVTFAIPNDVHKNGRIAALGGDYTFTLH